MKNKLITAALSMALVLSAAATTYAAVTGNVTFTVTYPPPPLVVSVSPAAITENVCPVTAGTFISAITAVGGDGSPVTLTLSGSNTDFALVSTAPGSSGTAGSTAIAPANVVAIAGGTSSANCGKTITGIVGYAQP
jgi:hypothetical protein